MFLQVAEAPSHRIRGAGRNGAIGVRLSGAKMLRVLARDCFGEGLRRFLAETGRAHQENHGWKKIRKAEEAFHVGNLYLNRKCTGAMVGAHPFGGFNMSGTDSKTGGKDYLLLFLQAKAVAEKVK